MRVPQCFSYINFGHAGDLTIECFLNTINLISSCAVKQRLSIKHIMTIITF